MTTIEGCRDAVLDRLRHPTIMLLIALIYVVNRAGWFSPARKGSSMPTPE
jgi:hypothetical protein